MPYQTSSTRNDYERKINYDWPNILKQVGSYRNIVLDYYSSSWGSL